jgi:hypothetical protein
MILSVNYANEREFILEIQFAKIRAIRGFNF